MCTVRVLTTTLPLQAPDWAYTLPLPQLVELREVLARLDTIDQALGLRTCQDDLKADFLRTLLARIERLEEMHGGTP